MFKLPFAVGPLLLPLALSAAVGLGAWTVQSWRLEAAKAQELHAAREQRLALETARATALEAARAREQDLLKQVQEAQDAHQQRLARLRHDSRAAGAELERLRHAVAQHSAAAAGGGGAASAASAAADFHPAAAAELLAECAAAHLELAQQADGHAADVRLLLDGWPR